jgi:hypothetical protein
MGQDGRFAGSRFVTSHSEKSQMKPQMTQRTRDFARRSVSVAAPVTAVVIGLFAAIGTAHGDGVDAEKQAKGERCATRLSVAILSQSAKPELMSAADPQAQVDAMLTTPEFFEHFARFLNSELNRSPGFAEKPGQDAVYFLSKYVLQNGKPWSDLFLGPYMVAEDGKVTSDAGGLGYFRSPTWMASHAGNDPSGLRLSSAFRIMQNVVGLKLVASTNSPNSTVEERSALGRKRAECASCHYDTWFALDKVAAVLSRRAGGGDKPVTFFDPPEGYTPQQVVDGTISNDKELLTKLVASENFSFNACRVAFKFLNGREDNTCEGVLIDQCTDEFKAKGTIQSALALIAKAPGFCQ